MHRIDVVDTHTGGEPTRVVFAGGPELGTGSLLERRKRFRTEFDRHRSAIVNEPRGSDVIVGALLVPPGDKSSVTGVIFFNNVGYLGMCGHGLMGVVVALGYRRRITGGHYRVKTPVGLVHIEYDGRQRVSIENVASYRYRAGVEIDVSGIGPVRGDIAWGGNWFFLVDHAGPPFVVSEAARWTQHTLAIREALAHHGITGIEGAEIDHIELCGPPVDPMNHGRNFVLCPGGAYDRSPCGTGTSAKIACLAADGKLKSGDIWRQESITGSVFEASYEPGDGRITPRITGTAYVNGENTLLLDDVDPLCWGIRG